MSSSRQADEITPVRHRDATVNGIRIHYLEWGGRGPTLVLLHGLYDDASVWKALAPHLPADYHIVAPDRRGAGGSDTPKNGYDPRTLSSDVIALIQHRKFGPVTLVGHSAGAETALWTAAKYPNAIRSLIMIDGGFWPKHDPGTRSSPAPCTKSPRECALKALENSSRDYDPETLYARVSSPTLLVFARQSKSSQDNLTNKAEQHVRGVAGRKLRHAKVAVIENTGHYVQKDQPQALAQAIRHFLSEIR